jgi:3-oxoacid CoA-transferase A subunit
MSKLLRKSSAIINFLAKQSDRSFCITKAAKTGRKSKNFELVKIFINADEAIKDIPSSSRLLVGGFGLCGVPESLINALVRSDTKDLVIVSNEGGNMHHGLDRLLEARKIKKMVCSFIGENKHFQQQFLSGELEVELVPQGSLAEKIRCGGHGIPGIYVTFL